MELLKGLLKWIILAILIILVVVLVIKYANKNETTNNNQKKEPTVNVVDRTRAEDAETEPDEDGLEPIQENLTVDSPDTASTGIKETIIGIMIIGFGFGYIKNHSTQKENS